MVIIGAGPVCPQIMQKSRHGRQFGIRAALPGDHHGSKAHTMQMYDAIQCQDFRQMGLLVRQTWTQNQQLDNGTNPPEVKAMTSLIDDLCLGYKLPGAGGGGYLYMVAKDPEAAARIKSILNENRRNKNARFVDMTLSKTGLQISRS